MKRIWIVLAFALVAAGCGRLTDPLAAEVGEREITFDRVQEELEQFRASDRYETLSQQGDIGAIERDFEQSFLAQLVRRAVLAPAAEGFGVGVTDADVAEQIEVIKADFPSETAFEEALKEQGLDLEALEGLVRDRLLEDAVRAEVTGDVGPTDDELRAYYEDNIDDFRQVEVSHILVAAQGEAEELVRELSAAPQERFEDLFARRARRSLDQQSGAQGGYLGFVQPDQFVPEFAQVVRSLEVGELSGPVQTEFGFHVIYVSARRTLSFEEVADQIEQSLAGPIRDDAFNDWLRSAYEDVWINPRFGEIDPVSGAISDPGAQQVPGAEAPVLQAPADELRSPAPTE